MVRKTINTSVNAVCLHIFSLPLYLFSASLSTPPHFPVNSLSSSLPLLLHPLSSPSTSPSFGIDCETDPNSEVSAGWFFRSDCNTVTNQSQDNGKLLPPHCVGTGHIQFLCWNCTSLCKQSVCIWLKQMKVWMEGSVVENIVQDRCVAYVFVCVFTVLHSLWEW